MDTSTIDVINKGMQCLINNLGTIDAERFIAFILRERFDYTKWQRDYFDSIEDNEFMDKAIAYAKNHPYKGNAEVI